MQANLLPPKKEIHTMFGFHIRTRSLDSSILAGSPKPTVDTPRSSNGGCSPRTEVGEVDTSAPFQSVKAAVSLFGDAATSPRNGANSNSSKPLLSKKPKTSPAADEVRHIPPKASLFFFAVSFCFFFVWVLRIYRQPATIMNQ